MVKVIITIIIAVIIMVSAAVVTWNIEMGDKWNDIFKGEGRDE